jgi:VanZ family protein
VKKLRPVHLFFILWCLLIFTLSSIPSAKISQQSTLDFILRKTAHITEYFVLYILSYQVFSKKHKSAFLFTFIYAIGDEYHQSFTPGRGPSVKDVFIDTIGIVLAYIFIWKGYFQKLPHKIQELLK